MPEYRVGPNPLPWILTDKGFNPDARSYRERTEPGRGDGDRNLGETAFGGGL